MVFHIKNSKHTTITSPFSKQLIGHLLLYTLIASALLPMLLSFLYRFVIRKSKSQFTCEALWLYGNTSDYKRKRKTAKCDI